jgi:hypothetical protein
MFGNSNSNKLMYKLFQPMISGDIQSPMGVANVEFVDPREPVAVSH